MNVGDCAEVDAFIARASHWSAEMAATRLVLSGTELAESIKWGKPCYSDGGKNIAIMQPMKEHLALMFFIGASLTDRADVLREQGPNSRSARRVCIHSVDDVKELAVSLRELVAEAISIERAGGVEMPTVELDLVDELQRRLDQDPALRAAFASLTPGRRREYNLFVSGAKQSATRETRITKCVEQILAGKGLRER